MNLHEYQAKKILSQNGIKIPKGMVAYTPLEAQKCAKIVSDKGPWMIKAQVHSGARNKGKFVENKAGPKGGIRFVDKIKDVFVEAERMLGSTIITKQTGPKGKIVGRLYVEAYSKVCYSFYVAVAIDRVLANITLLIADTTEDDINDIVANRPDKILRMPLNLNNGPSHAQTDKAAEFLCLSAKGRDNLHLFLKGMYKTFVSNDALMIEINPAGIMKNGEIIALDAKMVLDDKALYRHPTHLALQDDYEIDERSLKASRYGFSYYEFEGNIGCIANGDGIMMTIMDLLENQDNSLACALNIKGGVDREKIAAGIKVIVTNPRVEGILINILGGFVRCDLIADGILDAAAEVGMNVPVVVRFEGTNRDEAKEILSHSNFPLVLAEDMGDSVSMILKAVNEGE